MTMANRYNNGHYRDQAPLFQTPQTPASAMYNRGYERPCLALPDLEPHGRRCDGDVATFARDEMFRLQQESISYRKQLEESERKCRDYNDENRSLREERDLWKPRYYEDLHDAEGTQSDTGSDYESDTNTPPKAEYSHALYDKSPSTMSHLHNKHTPQKYSNVTVRLKLSPRDTTQDHVTPTRRLKLSPRETSIDYQTPISELKHEKVKLTREVQELHKKHDFLTSLVNKHERSPSAMSMLQKRVKSLEADFKREQNSSTKHLKERQNTERENDDLYIQIETLKDQNTRHSATIRELVDRNAKLEQRETKCTARLQINKELTTDNALIREDFAKCEIEKREIQRKVEKAEIELIQEQMKVSNLQALLDDYQKTQENDGLARTLQMERDSKARDRLEWEKVELQKRVRELDTDLQHAKRNIQNKKIIDATREERNSLQNDKDRCKKQIKALEEANNALNNEKSIMQKELDQAGKTINEYIIHKGDNDSQFSELKKKKNELGRQYKTTLSELNDLKRQHKQLQMNTKELQRSLTQEKEIHDTAIKAHDVKIHTLRKENNTLQQKLKASGAELETERNNLLNTIDDMHIQISTLKQQRTDDQRNERYRTESLGEINKIREQYENDKQLLAKKHDDNLKTLNDLRTENKRLNSQVNTLEQSLSDEKARRETESKKLNDKVKQLQEAAISDRHSQKVFNQDQKKTKTDFEEKRRHYEQKIEDLKTEIRDLNQQLNDATQMSSVKQRAYDHETDELNDALQNNSKLRETCDMLTKEKQSLQREHQKRMKNLNAIHSENKDLRSKMGKLENEVTKRDRETKRFTDEIKRLERSRDVDDTKKENLQLQHDLKKAKDNLEEEQRQHVKDVNGLKTEVGILTQQISDTTQSSDQHQRQRHTLKKTQNELEESREVMSKLQKKYEALQKEKYSLYREHQARLQTLGDLHTDKQQLNQQVTNVKKMLALERTKVGDMQNEIQSLKKTISDLRAHSRDPKYQRNVADGADDQRELRRKYEKAKDDLREALCDLEETKTRLSKLMGQKLTDNNPNIADLGDKNRPTKLAERYTELYDNQWTDAYEVIDTGSERETIGILIQILRDCMTHCQREAVKQLLKLREGVVMMDSTAGHVVSDIVNKQLKDCRKAYAETAGKQLYKLYITTLQRSDSSISTKALKIPAYLEECFGLCWLMCVQDPPVVLGAEIRPGDAFNTALYRGYTSSGTQVDFAVWPALFLHDGGPLLCKGIAQGCAKKQKKGY